MIPMQPPVVNVESRQVLRSNSVFSPLEVALFGLKKGGICAALCYLACLVATAAATAPFRSGRD